MEGLLNSAALPVHLKNFPPGHIDVLISTRLHSCPSLLEQPSSSHTQFSLKIKHAGQVKGDSQGSNGLEF